MKIHLRTILAVVSLLMVVAIVVMWCRSVQREDAAYYIAKDGQCFGVLTGPHRLMLSLNERNAGDKAAHFDRFWFETCRWGQTRSLDVGTGHATVVATPVTPGAVSMRVTSSNMVVNIDDQGRMTTSRSAIQGTLEYMLVWRGLRHGFLGFGWEEIQSSTGFALMSPPNGWRVAVPFWFLLSIVATPLVRRGWAMRRRANRVQQDLCAVCGYDLRATPNRCPECGTAPATDAP